MRHHLHRIIGLAAVLVALVAAARLVSPGTAGADVVRQQGFFATVLGWTSWYGSYGMGELGRAWCIDHGSRAPDPGFGYAPVEVTDHTAATKTALAWIVGRYGSDVDEVGAAAVMLALHDLAQANYPHGRLNIDGMTTGELAGFAGHEATILERARAYRADGLAHAHLSSAYQLSLTASAATPVGESTVTVRLTDGTGSPLASEEIALAGDEVAFSNGTTRTTVITAADGSAMVPALLGAPTGRIDASVDLPDLNLQAFGSTTTTAQRVVRPARVTATASVQIDRPPPGSITIRKTGDDEPYLPVTGARFTIIGPAGSPIGEVAAGADGTTTAVAVDAGHYRVVETQAPPGYVAAGPWELDVAAGQDVTLDVANVAIRGGLSIRKIDSVTGQPVAGARLQLAFDADHDGDDYEVEFEHVTTSTEPIAYSNLLPGQLPTA